MTPAQAIAMLDKQLRAHGEDVTLRTGNTTVGQKTVRAFVRGLKADELVGTITQATKRVTISPTDLGAFGEPTQVGYAVIAGKPCKIEGDPEILRMGTETVRINLMVKG